MEIPRTCSGPVRRWSPPATGTLCYVQGGGASGEDISNDKVPFIRKILSDVKKKTDLLTGAVMDDPVIHARTRGCRYPWLSRMCIDYGSGGTDCKSIRTGNRYKKSMIHTQHIHLSTGKFIHGRGGRCFRQSRGQVLLEIYESISILEQCLDGLEKTKRRRYQCQGPGDTGGERIGTGRSTRGEYFILLCQTAQFTCQCTKIRAPSYCQHCHIQEIMCRPDHRWCNNFTGCRGSLLLAATERIAVAYDLNSGRKIMTQWTDQLISNESSEWRKTLSDQSEWAYYHSMLTDCLRLPARCWSFYHRCRRDPCYWLIPDKLYDSKGSLCTGHKSFAGYLTLSLFTLSCSNGLLY